MIKAVIFDFEGVIVDSEPLRYETWRILFKRKFQVDLPLYGPDIASQINGRKQTDNVLHFLQQARVTGNAEELINERAKLLEEVYSNPEKIKPIEGLFPLLEFLKKNNIQQAIATSSFKDTTEKMMQYLKIEDYVDTLVTGQDVEHGKPAPDIFLKAAKQLATLPQDCLVIEDSINGIEAAKAAGMRCVAITSSLPREMLSKADLIIDRLDDLLEQWEAFAA